MITYEANIVCDGKDCQTEVISSDPQSSYVPATYQVVDRADAQNWTFIEDEHYCPECAETVIIT